MIFRNHTDIMQLESPERMNDMSDKVATFAQRLREGLSIRHMTQTELAKRSQISKSSISRYVNGDWEGKQGAVYQLAKALDVTEAWLMGYDVPMENDVSTIPAGFEPRPKTVKRPLVGDIACGEPITAEQNVQEYVDVPETGEWILSWKILLLKLEKKWETEKCYAHCPVVWIRPWQQS